MVAALSTAAYMEPMITIGKPNPYVVEFILKKLNIKTSSAVIVGDRLTTDIKAGFNANIDTILVKTGTGLKELQLVRPSEPQPGLILDSVVDIIELL